MIEAAVLLEWIGIVLTGALAVLFWTLGGILDVNSDSRFRLFTVATAFSFIALGLFLGFAIAAAACGILIWIYAIFAGMERATSG